MTALDRGNNNLLYLLITGGLTPEAMAEAELEHSLLEGKQVT